ncbi:galactose-1-epimerase [Solitalea longa]|uniref:Aldose 1-epimerase n=1 Tax=Solitalea longa TaxID=2079460 RepID=A0A2S5A4K2_9SPHI|nr:aldose epimerase family protein [Solitalea longa]POY37033.1 galactose-1-epimerase [Solitalea longa]
MQITREDNGKANNGQKLECITLENDHKTKLKVTNYGAIIMSIVVNDKNQHPVDVVLGFDKVEDYFTDSYLKNDYPYFGAVIGRYANRIKDGKFTLQGKDYQLAQTLGNDCLHGGVEGFDKKVWEIVEVKHEPYPSVTMKYVSPDGEENFPGNLTVLLTFSLNNDNEVGLEYETTTDKTTIFNLTHHEYFNLNDGEGIVDDYLLNINASSYLAQDENLVTNGNLVQTAGTVHDFKMEKPIGRDMDKKLGYDQSFVIQKPEREYGFAAGAKSLKSGIGIEILTTDPIVHLYTATFVPKMTGKNHRQYGPYSAFCLETQYHPNAINITSFPCTVINPGEKKYSKTVYKFRVEK